MIVNKVANNNNPYFKDYCTSPFLGKNGLVQSLLTSSVKTTEKCDFPSFLTFERSPAAKPQNSKIWACAAVSFKGTTAFDSGKIHAVIKQKEQEKKVDDFFGTHKDAKPGGTSPLAIIGAIVGVIIPAIMIAKKQNPKLKANSFKNTLKFLDINYKFNEIFTVGMGGILGGLAGGLADKKGKNKLKKLEEGTFQTMNLAIPTFLVSKSIELCNSKKSLNRPLAKVAFTLGSVLIGVNMAVTLSNMIDKKVFNKYECNPDRKFRSRDLVVHVDDLITSLVLAKIPLIDKFHLNTILPAVFAWNGYDVGNK